MKPIITVVIPVYNCERYVARAIKSVLDQPCGDRAEILVVDDGSTDKSGEVCDRIASENSNVYVIHKENGGVSTARNLGIEKATGEYIAFLDSDDWWEPGFLNQMQIEEFIGGADVFEFAYRKMNYYKTMERVFDVAEREITYQDCGLDRFDWQHPCAYVYRTDFLKGKQIRYPVEAKMHEDVTFVEMVLFHAHFNKRQNRIIFTYWELPSSCMHTSSFMDSLLNTEAVYKMKEMYYKQFGVEIDKEKRMALIIAENLPRLCIEANSARTKEYIENYCNRYLKNNPDKKLWKKCQTQLDRYNKHPTLFWLGSRVFLGSLVYTKRILYGIPYINRLTNYVFSRWVLKMHPIKNK